MAVARPTSREFSGVIRPTDRGLGSGTGEFRAVLVLLPFPGPRCVHDCEPLLSPHSRRNHSARTARPLLEHDFGRSLPVGACLHKGCPLARSGPPPLCARTDGRRSANCCRWRPSLPKAAEVLSL